jgi:predicted DNA-binding transcriptional regulator AlpA
MEDGLAGLAELAGILGVTKRTAQRYAKRADFPQPIATLAATPVWRVKDLLEWRKATLPLARDLRGQGRAT